MLNFSNFNDLIKVKTTYYLKNKDGNFYEIDLTDYKEIETELFIIKHVEYFLPDFDYLFDYIDNIFRKVGIMENPIYEALKENNLEEQKMVDHYRNVKIGLKTGLNYHIIIKNKDEKITINNQRKNPKRFIRTIKVYKEMLENYCQRNNDDKSLKYKEYIKMIEEGRIPLLFSYNNKNLLTDLIEYSNIINKKCYREQGDYRTNKIYSGFYQSHTIKYYDEEGNRYEVPISNKTHLKEFMLEIATFIDENIKEKHYPKKLIKKAK